MHLRYFSIPLVPNGDVNIDYFGPFSQFCTVFFCSFVAMITKVDLKEGAFYSKSSIYSDMTINHVIMIFFHSIST